MAALIYIHGFLSSPQSAKARITGDWLAANHPDISYHCPALSPIPRKARKKLVKLVETHLAERLYLIGSSLGGYWATWLAERYDLRAVLINPLADPQGFSERYSGQDLVHCHSGEHFRLSHRDFDDLLEVGVDHLNRPENFWLMVQTGDETLDYRQAVEKYRDSRQLIEQGGNHSFENYQRWLPDILTFLEKGQLRN